MLSDIPASMFCHIFPRSSILSFSLLQSPLRHSCLPAPAGLPRLLIMFGFFHCLRRMKYIPVKKSALAVYTAKMQAIKLRMSLASLIGFLLPSLFRAHERFWPFTGKDFRPPPPRNGDVVKTRSKAIYGAALACLGGVVMHWDYAPSDAATVSRG